MSYPSRARGLMARTHVCAILLGLALGCGARTPIAASDSTGGSDASSGTGGAIGGATGTGGGSGRGGNAGTGSGGKAGGSIDAGCGLCGTSPCPVRPGQPRVLVSSPLEQQIMAIAVSADTLYYGTYPNQTQGEIRAVPLAGGASSLVVSGVLVGSLRLEGSTLYYVDRGRSVAPAALLAISIPGGSPKLIALGNGLEYVVLHATGIYFGDRNSSTGVSRIMRTDRDGSMTTSFIDVMGVLWGFDMDDANIYWAEYLNGGGRLMRRPRVGGDTAVLSSTSEPVTSPLVDGSDIDYVEGTSTPMTCRSRVMAVAKSGGVNVRQISPGSSGIDVATLVRDDTHVYWASHSAQGAVLRTRKGETPEILAANQQSASGIVLSPTDVYWIARAGTFYEVRTVPK